MTMSMPKPRGDTPARPDIAASWQRAQMAGLRPESTLNDVTIVEVDRRSRLMAAAAPVLDRMTEQLSDTALGLALADNECRIVDLRFTDRRVGDALEQIRAVAGSHYTEEVSGTNSVATTFETRQGLVVNGAEHYLEVLKQFSCYGQPIRHPVTRRLEGVLDITGIMPAANPMFVPFVKSAVSEIEHRLLDGAARSEQHLLAVFQAAARRGPRAVVVLGDDLMLTNPRAVDLLESADHALLRGIALDIPAGRSLVRMLRLTSGRSVRLEATRIEGAPGTLLEMIPVAQEGGNGSRRRVGMPLVALSRVDRELRRLRGASWSVLVSGEPGTGRSSAVRAIAGDSQVVALDASEVPTLGERAWAHRFEQLAETHNGVLAVEEIQLLPDALCVRVARLFDRPLSARLVLTSAVRDGLDPRTASLAACCVASIELPPLRSRRDELPAIARRMLADERPGRDVRFTPSALTALAAHHWPGNLRELRVVVRHATEQRTAGDITTADLPESHRGNPRARALTPWQQAEHDAIVVALRATGGNKLQAAERLGISRSTLYNRIRALKIRV